MRHEVRARAALVAVVLVLCLPAASDAQCPGCLHAGAASVDLRVLPGAPLAGYGSVARRLLPPDVLGRHPHAFWFKPHAGTLDPLGARALVLDDGTTRLTWVAVDLIAVDRAFTREVERRLLAAGLPRSTLIISASHTHSGPGAFIDSALVGLVAADRADAPVRDALIGSIVDAVRRAERARGPARVSALSVNAPAVTVSRLGQPLDPEITILKFVSATGAPVALVWNFAIHATMLGPRNLELSGDVTGAASRTLERDLGVPVLFVNGAVGDVSPRRHGRPALAEVGSALAAAVRAGWNAAPAGWPASLAVRTARVELPPPALSLRNCIADWIPGALRLPLARALPGDAELVAAAVGDTVWVTIPGELQTRLGLEVKRGVRPAWARAFVAGVSNDYLGYFLAAADYDRVAYVACASLYGPEGGARLSRAAGDLLAALRGGGAGR
ncbi:MAG: neutral/alkaline non-lysosomal ceramidase N-terminal domain-containing protein [Candidatus Rokubacteria bacterium]|nr:neutral/alkaline non-lysosomal ceramidase N-terminal domain-containing protein [Candidatus Rokubacteria bacterium]